MGKNTLNKIDDLLAKNQWADAADLLEDFLDELVDQDADDKDVDVLIPRLVIALNHCQRYRDSFDYAVDDANLFLEDINKAKAWVTAALGAGQFIDARLFISSCEPSWREVLTDMVDKAEEEYRTNSAASLKTQLQAFYHLGDKPVVEQSKLLKESHKLPLKEFLVGIQFLLRDPFTNPLLRSNIIELLQQLQVNEKIKYLWIDKKEHEVIPNQITEITKDKAIVQALKELASRRSHLDPLWYMDRQKQLSMQGMLLYPRIDKVITDPVAWIDALVSDEDTDKKLNPEIIDWQNKLETEINSLASKLF